ncbi:hypothetical protein BvCmsF30A_04989 [Escherichia coli]|nr:hypothetical protein BvCmsF30A_04989 [Escherichia coli]
MPGQSDNLLTNQTLFVKTIPQAFEHVIPILRKRLLHVITAQPRLLVRKTRVRFNQIWHIHCRICFKQAAVRQTGIRPGNMDTALRCADFKLLPRQQNDRFTGRHHRAKRYPVSSGYCRIHISGQSCLYIRSLWLQGRKRDLAALNLSVAGELSRLQRDGLNDGGRLVRGNTFPLPVCPFLFDTIVVCGCPFISNMALSADTDVFHITGLHIQQTTCNHLTLVIKQFVCHNRHAGTGQYFPRVGVFYPGFLHGTGVFIFCEPVVVMSGIIRRVQVQQTIRGVVINEHPLIFCIPADI